LLWMLVEDQYPRQLSSRPATQHTLPHALHSSDKSIELITHSAFCKGHPSLSPFIPFSPMPPGPLLCAAPQVPYLAFLGFPMPRGESTADFLLDVVAGKGGGSWAAVSTTYPSVAVVKACLLGGCMSNHTSETPVGHAIVPVPSPSPLLRHTCNIPRHLLGQFPHSPRPPGRCAAHTQLITPLPLHVPPALSPPAQVLCRGRVTPSLFPVSCPRCGHAAATPGWSSSWRHVSDCMCVWGGGGAGRGTKVGGPNLTLLKASAAVVAVFCAGACSRVGDDRWH
jgi:hypothetical protein